ncbi:MAG: hypothetical protein ACYC5F_09645 [Thermoleophilia bacterium]
MKEKKNHGFIICHCLKARSEFLDPLQPAPPTICTLCGTKRKNSGLREPIFLYPLDSFIVWTNSLPGMQKGKIQAH